MSKEELLRVFFKRKSELQRYIARILYNRDDVEDVLQDTFMSVHAMKSGSEVRFPEAYLYRVARNAAYKARARRGRESSENIDRIEEISPEKLISNESLLEETVYFRKKLQVFAAAVDSLPPQCRKVLVLRKLHGLSHKQIASKLGIAQSTVEKHLAKGMLLCLQYMRREGYDDDGVSGGKMSLSAKGE